LKVAALTRTAVTALALGIGVGIGIGLAPRGDAEARALPRLRPGADFTGIARRTTPAVVNISALQVYRTRRSPFFSDPFFREFFGGDLPFRTPREERRTSLGSGVLVSSDGLIVTNVHVVQQARQIGVTTADGRHYSARLIGSDPPTDIAVLRIDGSDHRTLAWGDSARAAVGEYVLAVGNPFQLSQTVTMGIISATGRSNIGIADYEDFIQTDAAINPGNSGGALVDVRGALIGINTAIYSETGGYQGIGFAVPANLARRVVEQILEHGRVRRGWVGITKIGTLDDALARTLGLGDTRGAVVWELLRRGPAARAGIQPGDVVIAVDGTLLADAAAFRRILADAPVGSRLRLELLREGRRITADLEVEELPDQNRG
jgi:Do/DeqQ family serine protease